MEHDELMNTCRDITRAREQDRREGELYDAFRDELLARLTPADMVRCARDVVQHARTGADVAAIALLLSVLAPDPDPFD